VVIQFLLIVPLIFASNIFTLESKVQGSIRKRKEILKLEDRKLLEFEKKKELIFLAKEEIDSNIKKEKLNLTKIENEIFSLEKEISRIKVKITLLQNKIQNTKLNIFSFLRNYYFKSLYLKNFSLFDFSLTKNLRAKFSVYKKDLKRLDSYYYCYRQKFAYLQRKIFLEKKSYNTLEKLNLKLQKEQTALEKNIYNKQVLLNLFFKGKLNCKDEGYLFNKSNLSKLEFKNTPYGFIWPVAGKITSFYGIRVHPIKKILCMHKGIDIACAFGTSICAALDGKVCCVQPKKGYGYIVVLSHCNGFFTLYAHMYRSTIKVKIGDRVKKGQVIAKVGDNGLVTGPHLHFEILQKNNYKDPLTYLN